MQIRLPVITLLLFSQIPTLSADVPNGQRHEVEHLLNFIATTPCTINRNGSQHSGGDALGHIQKKWGYFRDEITSTETFIEIAASKSAFSGNVYTVQCDDGKVITTQEWLLNELAIYRRDRM